MTTVIVQVSASSDDAWERGNGAVTLTGAYLDIDSDTEWGGFRFLGVGVNQGQSIDSATLELYVASTDHDDMVCDIYGEDIDDAPTFTTDSSNVSNRTRTTAKTAVNQTGLGTGFYSITITSIVQEVLNRAGWTNGNDMVLVLDALSGIELWVTAWDGSTAGAAKLTIEYTAGATYTLDLDAGSYAVTGQNPSLLVNRAVGLEAGNYVVTGQAASLLVSRVLEPEVGNYTVTGLNQELLVNRVIDFDTGSYATTGLDASILLGRLINLETGDYTISGQSVDLLVSRLIDLEAGTYVVNGLDVDLIYSGAGATYTLDLETGNYAIAGNDAALLVSRILEMDAGEYVVAGNDADILVSRLLELDTGSYAIVGQNAALVVSRILGLDTGSYIIAGQEVTLVYSGDAGEFIQISFVAVGEYIAQAVSVDEYINQDVSVTEYVGQTVNVTEYIEQEIMVEDSEV